MKNYTFYQIKKIFITFGTEYIADKFYNKDFNIIEESLEVSERCDSLKTEILDIVTTWNRFKTHSYRLANIFNR